MSHACFSVCCSTQTAPCHLAIEANKAQHFLLLACDQINQIDHILVGHDMSPWLETSSTMKISH